MILRPRRTPNTVRLPPFLLTIVLLAPLMLTGPASVHAQESEEAPGTIVITAAAPEESNEPNVRVIDVAEAIEAGHTTVADAVIATPGVTIQRRGSGFESSTVRIRGSSAEQVLVLRDGQQVGSGAAGVTDLSRLSLHGVERIEVVFGPATALYGGGGAAGAINLISENGDGVENRDSGVAGSSRGEYGSFGEYLLGGELRLPIGEGELDLSVDGAYAQNEYSYGRDGTSVSRENAGGWQGQAGVSLTQRLDPGALYFEGSINHSNRGVPGTVEFPSDSARLEDTGAAATVALGGGGAARPSALLADASPAAGNRWGTVLRLSGSREERHYTDSEYPLGALSSRSTLYRLDSGVTARGPVGGSNLSLPASYTFEGLRESELGDRERHTVAVAPGYVAPRISLGRSSLGWKVNGRIELVSAAGETDALPSARASVNWRAPGELLESSFAVGAGYRLPTYAELFWPGGAFAVGNPDLLPELSRSAELELLIGETETAQLRLNTHLTLYRDLIQWLPNPAGYWRPRNSGEAITYGGEAAYTMRRALGLSPWSVEAEISGELLYARDRNPGPTFNKQLPYRPERKAAVQAAVSHLLGHRLGATFRAVGERPVTQQNTVRLDPYLAIDLSGAYAIPGTTVTLRGRLNNLLDQKFVETRFYPNPGRELVVAMEVSW